MSAVRSGDCKQNMASLQPGKCSRWDRKTESTHPNHEATRERRLLTDDPGCRQCAVHTELAWNTEQRDSWCSGNDNAILSQGVHPLATTVWFTRAQQYCTCTRFAHLGITCRRTLDLKGQNEDDRNEHRSARCNKPWRRVSDRHCQQWNLSWSCLQPTWPNWSE